MIILLDFEDSECDDSPVTDGYADTNFPRGWDGEEPDRVPKSGQRGQFQDLMR